MKASQWNRHLSYLTVIFALVGFTADVWAQGECLGDKRRRYRVKIDSAPQGAKIYVGQKSCGSIGTTPWTGKLPKGTWTIVLEKDGFEVANKSFRVRRTRRLQEVLMPMAKLPDPPRLDIRADADKNAFNASVWVDGQPQGKIPVLITVRSGRHLVQIKKDGFEDFEQWIEAKEGEKLTIAPSLKAKKVVKRGNILVEADVPGAEVLIDGNKHPDATPTMISGVTEGPHVIKVRKPPAVDWTQTVVVEANKTVKVSAELKATLAGPVGRVQVLSNVEGARVFLDGKDVGPTPADITDVKPGEHVIEVKADGYVTREERITVNAGSAAVLKLDLRAAANQETGIIKIVSAVPEAAAFIDGERVGSVPQEKELSAGDHFVVVTKPGYKKFEEKVSLQAGQTITITADLRAVGALRVLSNPSGAEVFIDGEPVGATPFNKEDIDVGEHVVVLRMTDHYEFEKEVDIEGGKRTIVRGKLEEIDTGPTADQLEREQRGLSSFGARALPSLRGTLDLAGGYPYYMNGQITVGFPTLAGRFPFDAGVVFRTFLSRTELAVKLRLTLVDNQPFSAGVFALAGGGSNLIDDSGRNSFFTDIGVLASLTAPGNITVTGRAYINFWSDRHCDPESVNSTNAEVRDSQIDVCLEPEKLSAMQLEEFGFSNHDELVNDRETGLRLMLSIIAELAFRQRWSAWLIVEGAPFQSQRPAYSTFFNGLIPFEDDILTYAQGGITYKF